MFNEIYGYANGYDKQPVIPMNINENLLINADYRYGVINRKGIESYGLVYEWTDCIDNWVYLSYGGITYKNGYLEINPDVKNIDTYF